MLIIPVIMSNYDARVYQFFAAPTNSSQMLFSGQTFLCVNVFQDALHNDCIRGSRMFNLNSLILIMTASLNFILKDVRNSTSLSCKMHLNEHTAR